MPEIVDILNKKHKCVHKKDIICNFIAIYKRIYFYKLALNSKFQLVT